MFRWAIFAGALVVSACAVQEPRVPVEVTQPTPTCSGQQECDAKWILAHEHLQSISGMRIQTATDSVLQTYGPIRGYQLGGVVQKFPVGADRYELRVRFHCRHPGPHCDDLRASATNAFNAVLQ